MRYPIAHYNDVIMSPMVSQITSLTILYSTVYSDADQIKHQSSASLVFVWGMHWGPVNSTHKWPVTRKVFLLDYVIMLMLRGCTAYIKPISLKWVLIKQYFACFHLIPFLSLVIFLIALIFSDVLKRECNCKQIISHLEVIYTHITFQSFYPEW